MSENIKIQPKTRSLADRIKLHAKGVDKDNNLVDDGLFRKIATEDGRDVDRMIEDDKYRADFIAGNLLAQGELVEAHMRSNKDVGTVSGEFEIGRNSMSVSFERHQRVPNRVLNKESGNFEVQGERDLYGESTVKYKVRGTQNSKGDIKAVREFLHGTFSSAFAT